MTIYFDTRVVDIEVVIPSLVSWLQILVVKENIRDSSNNQIVRQIKDHN